MKNVDQAVALRGTFSCGRKNRWAGWIVLLAIAFSGTQVSLAQHQQKSQADATRTAKVQGVPQSHEPLTSDVERRHWSADPGCFEQKSNIPDRTASHSWTLASPDGLYTAYAVNEAIAERSDGEISGCKSTTTLFVAGPDSHEAKTVLTLEPLENASGNSIELVDWSREGHRLLVIEGREAWASDAGASIARVYDADSGKMYEEALFYDAFEQVVGRKCVATFDPIGFSPDGRVVVRAYPDLDEEQTLEKDSCVKKVEVWDLDLDTRKLHRLPDRFEVRRYGTSEEQSLGTSALATNIPPANPNAYQSVRTSEEWLNPFLVVRRDGIEILKGNAAGETVTIPPAELIASLEKLPRSAWPYGRVVAVMEIGLRSPGDDVPIKKNLEELLRLLDEDGVKVTRWPSA